MLKFQIGFCGLRRDPAVSHAAICILRPDVQDETNRKQIQVAVSGFKELTAEEWNKFFDYLKDGSVEKRTGDAGDGGSGPWLYLYWNGDRSEYQVFTFSSYEKQRAFEIYCIDLKALALVTQE